MCISHELYCIFAVSLQMSCRHQQKVIFLIFRIIRVALFESVMQFRVMFESVFLYYAIPQLDQEQSMWNMF